MQAEALLRQVERLVAHLLRPLDPVAEIDVRQAEAFRFLDMVEDDERPKRPARLFGVIERIDERETICEAVGEADRIERSRASPVSMRLARAVLRQARVDM